MKFYFIQPSILLSMMELQLMKREGKYFWWSNKLQTTFCCYPWKVCPRSVWKFMEPYQKFRVSSQGSLALTATTSSSSPFTMTWWWIGIKLKNIAKSERIWNGRESEHNICTFLIHCIKNPIILTFLSNSLNHVFWD